MIAPNPTRVGLLVVKIMDNTENVERDKILFSWFLAGNLLFAPFYALLSLAKRALVFSDKMKIEDGLRKNKDCLRIAYTVVDAMEDESRLASRS